jgi:DNA-binding CsgD family transcriptional regulator
VKRVWHAISNIGIEYESDYFSKQNVVLLNQYTVILFFVFATHSVYDFVYFHNILSGCILMGLALFLVLTMTWLVKLRRTKFILFLVFIAIVYIIFFYESFCGGRGSGIYIHYYSLALALPFIFNYKTDMTYIVAVILAIIAAFLINVFTNYTLFTNASYLLVPTKQEAIFYFTMFDSIVILLTNIIFLIRKNELIYDLYAKMQIVELEHKSAEQQMEVKNLEIVNTKQELLITNLRLAQKNQLLEKAKGMDSRQIDKLIRQEKTMDKNFGEVSQMYLDISPEFYRHLTEKAVPHKLTNLDLKYCVYIYTKKSNKDIAEILNISYTSVKSHKRYLKRKLNLQSDDSLDFFIQHVSIAN